MNLKNNISEFSPMKYARIGGILYLIIILAGLFGELLVRHTLIVSGDPSATANKIMNSEMLWRIGISVDLIMQICDLPLMLIFYLLLKPINKNLALLNLLFNLIQTAVLVANKLNLLTALYLLGDATYLNNFNPDQLHTLSYIYIKLHDAGFGIGLIFFGFVCLIEGYLIFKSKYFPKAIGILMQIAGLCYLINCFTLILAPKLLSGFVLVPCLIGELSLCLWLIFKGVNMTEWNKSVEGK